MIKFVYKTDVNEHKKIIDQKVTRFSRKISK